MEIEKSRLQRDELSAIEVTRGAEAVAGSSLKRSKREG